MSAECMTGFAALGMAAAVILIVVLLTFCCVGLKIAIEDAIDRIRHKKRIRKVVYCVDCKYQAVAPKKTYCKKWQICTNTMIFCSSGKKKGSMSNEQMDC